MPQIWLQPIRLIAIWLTRCFRISSGSPTKAERILVGRSIGSFPSRSMKIEPLPESTPHARSFAAPRQNRRVAPARGRIGLVQYQGERHLRLRTARFRSRMPPQDRRDRSAAAEKGKPRARRVAMEIEATRLAVGRVVRGPAGIYCRR